MNTIINESKTKEAEEAERSFTFESSILASDFLDGTEDGFILFDAFGDRLSLVFTSKELRAFNEFNVAFQGWDSPSEIEVGSFARTPRNSFFLGRSLEKTYPFKPISNLVKEVVPHIEDKGVLNKITTLVRSTLKTLRVSNSLFEQDSYPVSLKIEGRVYLLTYMLILYNAEELELLPLL